MGYNRKKGEVGGGCRWASTDGSPLRRNPNSADSPGVEFGLGLAPFMNKSDLTQAAITTRFEPIEQHFNGTVKELAGFLYDYDLLRHGFQPPGSNGDYLVLTSVGGVEDLYTLRKFSAEGMELTNTLEGEGTWALTQMTAGPPRSRFICRPLTQACQEMALAIAGEIQRNGYGPAASDPVGGPSEQPNKARVRKSQHKRGPQLKTRLGLSELQEIRAEALENHKPIPKKGAALSRAGITDKTWRKYDPQLAARWFDKDYIPEKPE